MWLFKDSGLTFEYKKCGSETVINDRWTVTDCLNKKDEKLTMLTCKILNNNDLTEITNGLKRLKTIKHPDILSYVDSNQDSKQAIIIVEYCTPLTTFLKSEIDKDNNNLNFLASWGLITILRALQFLHEKCQLSHNFVNISSIFVSKNGDWKLGILDYVESIQIKSQKFDSQGFSKLVWEIFNHKCSEIEYQNMREPRNIPQQLVKIWLRIHQSQSTNTLPSMAQIEKILKQGFSENFYVKMQLFLDEIHGKTKQEQSEFLTQLPAIVSLPHKCLLHKILPIILMHISSLMQPAQSTQDDTALAQALSSLIQLAPIMQQHQEQQQNHSLSALLVRLFLCHQRRTRVLLLDNLQSLIPLMDTTSPDTTLLTCITSSLADTHPLVRETGIRACVHLVPYISAKSLHDILLRSLFNIQAKDDQGGIRANVIVCLTKIYLDHFVGKSSKFASSAAVEMIVNCILRGTRDKFPPARRSSLIAVSHMIQSIVGQVEGADAQQQYITVEMLATKILPCLCFLTIDTETELRSLASDTIRAALDIICSQDHLLSNGNSDHSTTSTTTAAGGNQATSSSWLRGAALANIQWLSNKILQQPESKSQSLGGKDDAVATGDQTKSSTLNADSSHSTCMEVAKDNDPTTVLGIPVYPNKSSVSIGKDTQYDSFNRPQISTGEISGGDDDEDFFNDLKEEIERKKRLDTTAGRLGLKSTNVMSLNQSQRSNKPGQSPQTNNKPNESSSRSSQSHQTNNKPRKSQQTSNRLSQSPQSNKPSQSQQTSNRLSQSPQTSKITTRRGDSSVEDDWTNCDW